MEPKRREILERAGLDGPEIEALGKLAAGDASSDAWVRGDDEGAVLLGLAVLAAGDPALFRTTLPRLLDALSPLAANLSDTGLSERGISQTGRGILQHLQGLRAWRLHGDVPAATRRLNESLRLLEGAQDDAAQRYEGRVFDSFGQLLLDRGQLFGARRAFERALALKEAVGDEAGTALTEGNLGRLLMAVGEFETAAEHLARDLEWVEKTSPSASGLLSQLRTQIGICHLELGGADVALRHLEAGRQDARRGESAIGLAFSGVYLGLVALHQGRVGDAEALVRDVEASLRTPPLDQIPELSGLHAKASAEVAVARGDLDGALGRFEAAEEHFGRALRVSPIEHAGLLAAHADACLRAGRFSEAGRLLRRALRHLDATTATAVRVRIDAQLKAADESAWMLHRSGRFVGHGQIEALLHEGGQSGFRGQEEDIAVLFSDIRGFTQISEGLEPEALIELLNRYLTYMTRCVDHFGGMVDKFIGDAVMALFSLPKPHDDDPDRAVAAAWFMQAELERFNRGLPPGTPPFKAGIGLHVGGVVAGLIGSPQKRSYTVVGDVVNTASRLEGMTKLLGVPILVSDALVSRLQRPERWVFVPMGCYRPKGRKASVCVHYLAGAVEDGEDVDALRARAREAAEAIALFEGRQFEEAARAFERLRIASDGRTGQVGYARLQAEARRLGAEAAPDDWDGALVLQEK